MWSSWARPVLPRASLASPARWHMVHSIHVSRHTVYWAQAQVGFGRVYFPGPNRVGARAHFMRWAQPILRLSRRACARANDGLASVNAGQPLMKICPILWNQCIYSPKRTWFACHSQLHPGNYGNKNMNLDKSVCLIFGSNVAAKPNRRQRWPVKAKMIFLSRRLDSPTLRKNVMIPLQAKGL